MLLNEKPSLPNSAYELPFHGVRLLALVVLPSSSYVYVNNDTSTKAAVSTRNVALKTPSTGPDITTTTPPSASEGVFVSDDVMIFSSLATTDASLFNSNNTLFLWASSFRRGELCLSTNTAFTATEQVVTAIDGGLTKKRFFIASAFRINPTSLTSGDPPEKSGSISCSWNFL